MKQNVLVGKALGFECPVQRVIGNLPAVNGQIDTLSTAVLRKGNIVSHPAFHPAPLIVIAPGAFFGKITAELESVDIEILQVGADSLEVFDQFVVGQKFSPPMLSTHIVHDFGYII